MRSLGTSPLQIAARAIALMAVAVGLGAAIAPRGTARGPAAHATAGVSVAPVPSGHPRPNVLLVSIDSLRSDHLGAYGYARNTSPAIDALAREGVTFTSAISPSAWTLPAHATLLTALPPEKHGLIHPRRRLDPRAETLAEVMRDAGYDTAGFVSGPFLRSAFGYAAGFERYDQALATVDKQKSHRGVTSPHLVGRVTRWLRHWYRERERRPFFIFLHMWDVHYDYAPPVPYDRLFDPEYTGKVDGLDFELGWQVHRSMDRRDLEHVIALYDGEIRFTDSHLGRLIGLLRKVDVLDDTIVVVTSDHGDEFFEHGNKGHAKALFDETIRVPLILRYPRRIAPGQVISAQVRLADVAPTILGLAGVPAPAGFGLEEGFAHAERDLTPWLTGAEAPESFPRLLAFGETSRVPPAHRFARSPEGKLILTPAKKRSTKIFDLERDPGEQVNLANPNREPAFAATLKEEADLWMKQFQGKQDLAAPLELDPALEQHLRALGYIQ